MGQDSEADRSLETRIRLILVIILILSGGIFLIWKYPDWAQSRRDFAMRKAVTDSLAENDYPTAMGVIQRSLQVDPDNLAAIQLGTDIATKLKLPGETLWREKLLQQNPSDQENCLRLIELLLIKENLGGAEKALLQARNNGPLNARFWNLQSLAYILARDLDNARLAVRNALEADPDSVQLQINLACLYLIDSSEGQRAIGREMAETIARRTSRTSVYPLIVTSLMSEGSFSEALNYSIRLLEESKSLRDWTRHGDILHELKDRSFDDWADNLFEVVATYQDIVDITAWMIGHDQADKALKWLESLPAESRKDPRVKLALADCCHQLGDWSRIRYLLGDETGWDKLNHLRLAHLAHATLKEGEQRQARLMMQRARTFIMENNLDPVVFARLLNQWGNWEKELREFLWTIYHNRPSRMVWALVLLGNHYRASKSAAGLFQVSQKWEQLQPGDFRFTNNRIYYGLLLYPDRDDLHEEAQLLFDKYSDSPEVASTFALSLILENRNLEAEVILNTLSGDNRRHPSIAILDYIILYRHGYTPETAGISANYDFSGEFPQLLKILEQAQTESE